MKVPTAASPIDAQLRTAFEAGVEAARADMLEALPQRLRPGDDGDP